MYEAAESTLLALMHRITAEYPAASLFSLPSFGGEGVRRHIELGVRGEPEAVAKAMEEIRTEVSRLGYEWAER